MTLSLIDCPPFPNHLGSVPNGRGRNKFFKSKIEKWGRWEASVFHFHMQIYSHNKHAWMNRWDQRSFSFPFSFPLCDVCSPTISPTPRWWWTSSRAWRTRSHSPKNCWQPWNDCGSIAESKNASVDLMNTSSTIPLNSKKNKRTAISIEFFWINNVPPPHVVSHIFIV